MAKAKRPKKLSLLKWEAVVDGKTFGSAISKFEPEFHPKSREEITTVVRVLAEQMNQSLQKIITGKSGMDALVESAERLYDLGGKLSGKELEKEIREHERLWHSVRIR